MTDQLLAEATRRTKAEWRRWQAGRARQRRIAKAINDSRDALRDLRDWEQAVLDHREPALHVMHDTPGGLGDDRST